jgi:hypothetical protein
MVLIKICHFRILRNGSRSVAAPKSLILATLPLYINQFAIEQGKLIIKINDPPPKSPAFAYHLCNRYSKVERVLFTQKGDSMLLRKPGSIFLASSLALLLSASLAVAQSGATQDMKNAGTDTKNAAKETGHGVSTGTQKAYHKTTTGTKTAAHKTSTGTKKVYHKTASGTRTTADKTANGTKTVGKDIGHGTATAAKGTAHGTEKLGDKIAGKPTPPQ